MEMVFRKRKGTLKILNIIKNKIGEIFIPN
jgi:hypothetical protein